MVAGEELVRRSVGDDLPVKEQGTAIGDRRREFHIVRYKEDRASLGAKRAVTSPTFCLVVEHPTDRFLLVHMDLYRLHDADDVLTIGWEDYLSRGAVLFVEWPDRAGDLIPASAWHVSLALGEDEERRTISFRHGA